MVPELVLALSDPLLGALANGLHDVWVTLAQMPLLVHQARDVVADHTGPQRTDVPDRAQGGEINEKPSGSRAKHRHTLSEVAKGLGEELQSSVSQSSLHLTV